MAHLVFKKNIQIAKHVAFYDDIVFPSEQYERYSRMTKFLDRNDVITVGNIMCLTMSHNRYGYYDIDSDTAKTITSKLGKNITDYIFEDCMSIFIYSLFLKYDLIKPSDSVLICAKNDTILDAVNYLFKYQFNVDPYNNILFYFYQNESHRPALTLQYLIDNHINYVVHDKPLSLKYDVVACDLMYSYTDYKKYNANLPYLYAINHNARYPSICFLMGLQHLKKGGTFVIYHAPLQKKYMVDLFAYVATHFKKNHCFVFPKILDEMAVSDPISIFSDYDGNCDLSIFRELINPRFWNDGTFTTFITNIFDVNATELYARNRKKCLQYFNNIGKKITLNTKNLGTKYIEYMLYKIVYYLRRININIVPWYNMQNYFLQFAIEILVSLKSFKTTKLDPPYSSINCSPHVRIDRSFDYTLIPLATVYNAHQHQNIPGLTKVDPIKSWHLVFTMLYKTWTKHANKNTNVLYVCKKNNEIADAFEQHMGKRKYTRLFAKSDKVAHILDKSGSFNVVVCDVKNPYLLLLSLFAETDGVCVFRIKNIHRCTSDLFISNLFFVMSKYKKIKLFKSYFDLLKLTIYIICVGFSGTLPPERAVLLNCIKNGSFLVDIVPASFCKKYSEAVLKVTANDVLFSQLNTQISRMPQHEKDLIVSELELVIAEKNTT